MLLDKFANWVKNKKHNNIKLEIKRINKIIIKAWNEIAAPQRMKITPKHKIIDFMFRDTVFTVYYADFYWKV